MKCYITVGLPGAGKRTWAQEFVKENPSYVNINANSLAEMMFMKKMSPIFSEGNKMVMDKFHAILTSVLMNDVDLIISNTNTKLEVLINIITNILGAKKIQGKHVEFVIVVFNTDAEECEKRIGEDIGEFIPLFRRTVKYLKDNLTKGQWENLEVVDAEMLK